MAGSFDRIVGTHCHLEQVGTGMDTTKSVLIVGVGDIGHHDVERARLFALTGQALGLAADAIHAAGALLQRGRVPGQVMVDDVAALSV